MKLRPETREALAAEYALGTLRGRARARLDRHLATDADLRRRVERWEDNLQPLARGITPVPPAPQAWAGISRRLGFEARATARLGWGWLSAAAAAVVVTIGALLWQPVIEPLRFQPDVQVDIADAHGRYWHIAADTQRGKLAVAALGDVPVADDKSLELWLIRPGDQAPVPLGLMPVRLGEQVALRATTDLGAGVAFAVSLEPRGGSPTGLPTGPVLHVKEFKLA